MAISALSPAPRTSCDRTIAVYLSFSLDDLELFANLVEHDAGVLQLTEQVEPPLVIELSFLLGSSCCVEKDMGASLRAAGSICEPSASSVLMHHMRRLLFGGGGGSMDHCSYSFIANSHPVN